MTIKTLAKWAAALAVFGGVAGTASALDPTQLKIIPPADIKWNPGKLGDTAALYGDSRKDGELYVQLIKWHPNQSSRPHSHPHDRYITVLEGTFWVNTGPKYDKASMVPVKPGSWVFHPAGGIHYDGTREDGALIQVVGIGPGTTIDREEK